MSISRLIFPIFLAFSIAGLPLAIKSHKNQLADGFLELNGVSDAQDALVKEYVDCRSDFLSNNSFDACTNHLVGFAKEAGYTNEFDKIYDRIYDIEKEKQNDR